MKFLSLSVVSMAVCLSVTQVHAQSIAPDGQVIGKRSGRGEAPPKRVSEPATDDAPVAETEAPSEPESNGLAGSFEERYEKVKQANQKKSKEGDSLESSKIDLDSVNRTGKKGVKLEILGGANSLGTTEASGVMFLGLSHQIASRNIRGGLYGFPDGKSSTFGGLFQVNNLDFLSKNVGAQATQIGEGKEAQKILISEHFKFGMDGTAEGSFIGRAGSMKGNFNLGLYVSPEVQFETGAVRTGVGLKVSPLVLDLSNAQMTIPGKDQAQMYGNLSSALGAQGWIETDRMIVQIEGSAAKGWIDNKDADARGVVVNTVSARADASYRIVSIFSLTGTAKVSHSFANLSDPGVDQDAAKVNGKTNFFVGAGVGVGLGADDGKKSQRAIDANRAQGREDAQRVE